MVNASSRLFVPLLVMHVRDTSCRLTFQLARSDKQFCLLAAKRFLVN